MKKLKQYKEENGRKKTLSGISGHIKHIDLNPRTWSRSFFAFASYLTNQLP